MTTILGRTRSTTALTYTIRLHYQIVISDAEFMYNFMLIRKSRVDCGCSQVVASQRGDGDHKDSSGRSRGGAWEGPGSPLILGKKKKNRRIKKSWQGK